MRDFQPWSFSLTSSSHSRLPVIHPVLVATHRSSSILIHFVLVELKVEIVLMIVLELLLVVSLNDELSDSLAEDLVQMLPLLPLLLLLEVV